MGERSRSNPTANVDQQRLKKNDRRNGGQGSALLDRSNFLESAVRTAETFNKILMEHCSLCTVYCDQQVQYETSASNFIDDQYRLSEATVGQLFQQMDINAAATNPSSCGGTTPCGFYNLMTSHVNAPGLSSSPSDHRIEEVKQCQSNLFDEDSVIHSVHSRQDGEDHDDALVPPKGY